MLRAAEELVSTKPERVIVLDPHLTRFPDTYACVEMPSKIYGDFRAFGRPDLEVEFPSESSFCSYLTKNVNNELFSIEMLDTKELDHGAMVPLWFLASAGFKGSVCIIGFPWKHHQGTHTEFGRLLKQACSDFEGRTAIIASGDLSHRLQYGAPSGYSPRAHEFDKAFKGFLDAGELLKASQIPLDLRDLAAEDSSESMAIVAGAVGETAIDTKVLSYEAPFGVGYLVAILA
jgi:aromatic ring-opening dioxygenase LigB subunit